MKIYPAIDLLGGNVVRLHQGKRSEALVYSNEPAEIVRRFASAGAERVHVVDLDGAFSGERAHREALAEMAAASPVPLQVGGGIRDRAALEAVFATGAGFAVLGTAAVKNPAFAREACAAHPGCVIVAVDARDGVVAIEGWVESAGITAEELGKRAADWGAAGLLYTDVMRDGAQVGPNIATTAALAQAVDIPVIASGGVGTLDDIRALAAAGVPSVVVGRALYENKFTLPEALAAARGE
ncbi:1-(5-phosphoribosyl)-5-[(5-phosphoribosylamino)methylideneamino]imidazole-4-carboxamide isomerase [Haliangium ochraceum]|uniref:1-(5-phosphoribosyl)-5-[(5-phosphoribosylamino)methylideneamino] imidazole-4-carboxamide isomerase n=1 Tax=Haliangium ochraceum (strain DSM 14365 / JCM 11303 / SMP-2) TaxID=502025 RepID=D0LIZ1_HALO1|nr:1-(5-phosphoribosyl)-5-[(5-phosphoribosylamino)methylideneamino]imidazole-4-carboxamide isomerase [Haliangium ochraceum]ACY13020.1 phosphoribosylformimino-5-aminoimidazole carboxamide ribotide isomerase [Haliangium ochraceum DSM 14365]